MPEPNEQTPSPPQPKELCTIRVMFPVMSDEQALEVKKRLSDVLADIADTQVHFSLSTIPKEPTANANRIRQPNRTGLV